MDVNTAFVNSDLDRDNVFFNLPDGYKVYDDDGKDISSNYVLHGKRALYGMPQAPLLWNQRLTKWLLDQGFVQCKKDKCVFTYNKNGSVIRLIVYVDDLAFAGNDPELIRQFKENLSNKDTGFSMKDLGTLRWFLGMHVEHDLQAGTLTIHQRQYIENMMKRYDFMKDVAPTALPANPDVKLTKADCPLPEDNADAKYWWRPLYRSVVGSLLYAQCADRPDISVAVSKLSQFLDNPGPKHWEQAVHCLAYLKGTPELGITYTRKPAEHPWSNRLTMFVDATWADCTDTRKSTTGFVGMLNGGPVCWKSQKQPIVAQSSCEAEFIAACKSANEVCFIRQLLGELGAA